MPKVLSRRTHRSLPVPPNSTLLLATSVSRIQLMLCKVNRLTAGKVLLRNSNHLLIFPYLRCASQMARRICSPWRHLNIATHPLLLLRKPLKQTSPPAPNNPHLSTQTLKTRQTIHHCAITALRWSLGVAGATTR